MSETKRPILTASGEVIYGETPEDGIIARVYGDPELATMFAAAPDLLRQSEELICQIDKSGAIDDLGHKIENLKAVVLLRATIARAEGKEGERDDG